MIYLGMGRFLLSVLFANMAILYKSLNVPAHILPVEVPVIAHVCFIRSFMTLKVVGGNMSC